MTNICPVQCIRVTEHRCSFFKGHPVFRKIADGLPRIPSEHITVYTLIRTPCQFLADWSKNARNRKLAEVYAVSAVTGSSLGARLVSERWLRP